MRTTQDYDVGTRYAGNGYGDVEGTGWVVFAAIMLGIVGIWNFFEGIAAISGAHVYVADAHFVFSDLKTWGWIVTILGICALIAAMGLLTGSELARWFGIVVAGINAIGQLMFIPAYPLWGISMFAVDVLIIYGLAAYAGKRLRG
jgi:hypothetical protein